MRQIGPQSFVGKTERCDIQQETLQMVGLGVAKQAAAACWGSTFSYGSSGPSSPYNYVACLACTLESSDSSESYGSHCLLPLIIVPTHTP